jgi:hypothetical protein
MTGRERLTNILDRKPTDGIAWTTLVDDKTRSGMAEDLRRTHPFDFYRKVGCDILQFGNYGFWGSEDFVCTPWKLSTAGTETMETTEADGSIMIQRKTKWGTLTALFREGHPVKHPVESIEELRILKNIWLHSRYEEDLSDNFERNLERIETKIGDDGIYVHTVNASPVQLLLEYETGVANFYYLLQDHPDEVIETLKVIHQCRKDEYEILARRSPVRCVIPVENTSTTMISPEMYERLSLPQISDFVEIMHGHGKLAILHMCGRLKGLLSVIKETGLDGVNGLTPAPVGDVSFDDALDTFGEDFILLGGILDPSVIQKQDASKREIWNTLEGLFTPRIRRAHFLLWLGADGQPMPLDRFLAVRDWFNGQRET